jgi:predicted peroxiredoxin
MQQQVTNNCCGHILLPSRYSLIIVIAASSLNLLKMYFNNNLAIAKGPVTMNKSFSLILLTLLYLGFNSSVLADDDDKKLFVSLISDDLDRAAMAVSISNKVLSTGDIPVTIFLSAQGVRWVDKNIPQNRYVNGKTISEMLQAFMKSGGQVIVCKMCMENIGGIKKEDVIEGVKFKGTLQALFADNTTVLTY